MSFSGVVKFSEPFVNVDWESVHRNVPGRDRKILIEVAARVFKFIKEDWPPTKWVRILGETITVGNEGSARIVHISNPHITSERTDTTSTGGASKWKWWGSGYCDIEVQSF